MASRGASPPGRAVQEPLCETSGVALPPLGGSVVAPLLSQALEEMNGICCEAFVTRRVQPVWRSALSLPGPPLPLPLPLIQKKLNTLIKRNMLVSHGLDVWFYIFILSKINLYYFLRGG